MLKYKIFSNPEILENKKLLMDFFQIEYGKTYWKVLKNTEYVCTCLENKKIIGGARIITDKNRFALFCDFSVLQEYRNKGVGSGIMKKLVKYKKLKVKKIILTTDPRFIWLVDFYYKFGFKKYEGTYMELKNDTIG